MVEIDQSPTRTSIIITATMLAMIVATIALAPVVFPSDDVTVEDRGPNSVVIDNAGDEPVTATIDSNLFTFNATVDGGQATIVPTDDADDVTIHSEAGR